MLSARPSIAPGIFAALLFVGLEAKAAAPEPGSTPATLPRPGYDPPPPLRIGSTALRFDYDLSAIYDSNVYATHKAAQDDGVMRARLRATASNDGPNSRLDGEAYVERNQHIDITRENSTSYGALVRGNFDPNRGQRLDATIRYDRAIESRSDPEARADIRLSPRKIDIFGLEGNYGFNLAPVAIAVSMAAQSFDYRDANERDRDLRDYRGSVRISRRVGSHAAAFVAPYVTRRDFRTPIDLSGVNRDSTTIGMLAGVSLEGRGAVHGRMGAGFFRFRPDALSLQPFTGFSASGELTWSPRRRTSITAIIFSGDVATVRAGATGRHDSSISLRLDQEARHNLLLNTTLSWGQARYRGAEMSNRTTLRGQAEVIYFLNRRIALFAQGSVTHRTAPADINRFGRQTAAIGIRYQR